jgi:hypothetical protein
MQTTEDLLQGSQAAIREQAHLYPRLIPSSFDPNDDSLQALAIPRGRTWNSLALALKHCGAKIVLVRLPLFWQMLSPIHDACTEARCTLFVNEQDNMPLADAAMRTAEANMVVTDSKDAFALSLFLAEKNRHMPNWFIIHEADKEWAVPVMIDLDAKVVQEVHVFPGVPLLVQCESLSAERSPHFHAAPDMSFEMTAAGTLVSSSSALLVPLNNYQLNVLLALQGTCACGEEILARKP